MRTSRDFGPVNKGLVKKVVGFYKTVLELDDDYHPINPRVMSYDELISDFGIALDPNRWEIDSTHKLEIDRRYVFKGRTLPVTSDYNIQYNLGTDLKGADEPLFKDSILKVNMQPVRYTV